MAKIPDINCSYCYGAGWSNQFSGDHNRCMCTFVCWSCKDTGKLMNPDDVLGPLEDCYWCGTKSVPGVQEQPMPVANDLPDITELVKIDLFARRDKGIETYGQTLKPFNGRNALLDAYAGCLDLAQYLRQKIYEETGK